METKKHNINGRGFGRLVRAFACSLAGFKAAFKHEPAFRQELLLCLPLTPLAFWFGRTGIERAMLLGSLFLVLIVELLNSSLEAVVDRIGSEQHPLSGRAKDLGSAAVFVALANLAAVWLCIIL